jgi:hypothetical protein
MTTGRINQVTILSQRAEAQGRPPEGSEFTKQGDAEATQVTTLLKPKAIIAWVTDSIAPTEFPKSWSATSHARRCRRKHFRYMQPSGGENAHLVTRKTRKLGRVVPKDLVNIWQSQQSTDPKWCPPKRWKDFSSTYKCRWNTRGIASIYGQGPPTNIGQSRRGHDCVQQRINFTSRYQGNKASFYETKFRQAENRANCKQHGRKLQNWEHTREVSRSHPNSLSN